MKSIFLIILLLVAIVFSEFCMLEDKVTGTVLINYRMYSDEYNSSFLPFNCSFSGEAIWERKSLFINNFLPPVHLAIHDSILIIWYSDKIDLTNKLNGTSIWQKEIMSNADFDLKNNGLVLMNPAGFYEIHGLDQKLVEQYSLPFLSNQTKLYYSEKMIDTICYVYQNIPTPTNSPDEKFSEPEIVFARFNLIENDFIWQFIKKEFMICVLKTRKNNKFCIATSKNIYLIDSNSTSENQVQSFPFEKILSISLDFQDNILVVNETEVGKELKCITQDNKFNWSFSLENVILSGQPPASHPNGNVYIVLGNILKCINSGNAEWSYLLPVHPGKALITVLKDKSVLVSADTVLMQISSEGELIEKKYFNHPLTCRPIVDEDGTIYISNQESIFALK